MTTKKKVILVLLSLIVIHVFLAIQNNNNKRPMSDIAHVERLNLKEIISSEHVETAANHEEEKYEFWVLNKITLLTSWVVIILLVLVTLKGCSNLKEIPGRLQAFIEIIVEVFDELSHATLGKKYARKYMPLILTIFMYVLLSNWAGVMPPFWHVVDKEVVVNTVDGTELNLETHRQIKNDWREYVKNNPKNNIIFAEYISKNYNEKNQTKLKLEYKTFLPGWLVFEEPTQDLNVTLGLGVLVFIVVIFAALKKHGFGGVFKELSSPFIIMLPMNIIGEIGKVVSHSFRLFGNIKGGVIIMVVISYLIYNVFLPVMLVGYFGLFVGLIQAFVFTMLALVYIAVWVAEEESDEVEETVSEKAVTVSEENK